MPPSAPKQSKSSLNPNWPQYACFATIWVALLAALMRYFVIDAGDPYKCSALLNTGRWADSSFKAWQPDGCMTNNYNSKSLSSCLAHGRRIVFIGDSITRQLFYAMAKSADPLAPEEPIESGEKHKGVSWSSEKTGLSFEFHWDPFLNATHTTHLLSTPFITSTPPHSSLTVSKPQPAPQPAMLILGSGLWYLRHPSSGGLSSWEARIDSTFDLISTWTSTSRPHSLAHPIRKPSAQLEEEANESSIESLIADEIVFLPVLEPIQEKLSADRRETLLPSEIDAMNSDLAARLSASSYFYSATGSSSSSSASSSSSSHVTSNVTPPPISLPLSFNALLDPAQTTDGLHFAKETLAVKAQLLWNLRCNDAMPKAFPMDKTCCKRYPHVSLVQGLVLLLVVGWLPLGWFFAKQIESIPNLVPLFPSSSSPLFQTLAIFSFSILLTFLADRTPLWLKENKSYDPWTFGLACLASLAVGLATCKRSEGGKDLGFLNRDQTDEWKGWMQIAILIYHYLGASKISGIYNPIRVLVAAYLFMTGYGHFTYYYKKNDFGMDRIAMVMVRLNLLPIVLAYTMETDYISYYFSPLVSFWYLIIYATMLVGHQFNKNHYFLTVKLLLSMLLVVWFMKTEWILQSIFNFLKAVAFVNWSAKEWSFRVNLDIYAPFLGMFTAYLYILFQSSPRLSTHVHFPVVLRGSLVLATLALIWFFHFELTQPSKFTYNAYHPIASAIPILGFVALRNATPFLRSVSSGLFCWIGRISLETFILQFHLWLAADTKGILIIVSGGGGGGLGLGGLGMGWRWVNAIVTTVVFLFVSQKVSHVTGVLTDVLVGRPKKPRGGLPLPVTTATTTTMAAAAAGDGIAAGVIGDGGGRDDDKYRGGSKRGGGEEEEAVPLLAMNNTPINNDHINDQSTSSSPPPSLPLSSSSSATPPPPNHSSSNTSTLTNTSTVPSSSITTTSSTIPTHPSLPRRPSSWPEWMHFTSSPPSSSYTATTTTTTPVDGASSSSSSSGGGMVSYVMRVGRDHMGVRLGVMVGVCWVLNLVGGLMG